mmetsp:Transcript_15166/g.43510  ORF Transcript_15166/g.43510 Transcript_15166/m.43510 type:complete len:249 (-) Transcript_15166:207-953(-)
MANQFGALVAEQGRKESQLVEVSLFSGNTIQTVSEATMSNHELLKTLSGYVAASSSAASSLMRAELLEQADAKLDKKGEAAAQRAAAEKAEDVAVAAAKARWAFKQEDKVVRRDGGESKYREVIGDAKLLKEAAEAEANELEAAAAAAETAAGPQTPPGTPPLQPASKREYGCALCGSKDHNLTKTTKGVRSVSCLYHKEFKAVIGKEDEVKFVKLTPTERAAKRAEEAAKKAKEAAKEEEMEQEGEP